MKLLSRLFGLMSILASVSYLHAANTVAFDRTEDVIYGRKYGTALTMDVFTPKADVNGAAVIWVVSGGWFSAHEMISTAFIDEYLKRGYTVFAVVHGSQPKYSITEVLEDMNRSVRFIRFSAKRFNIDPQRIGITGGSAGGHLSLMIGMAGSKGAADAKDPIDRESSRVQAVGCFFPPTDFLNFGEPGRDVYQVLRSEWKIFNAPFQFRELDPQSRTLKYISDQKRRKEIARQISPITHVTSDDPPTLIIQGDKDPLVPLQQAEVMVQKLKEAHVPVKLVVKPGGGHGGPDFLKEFATIADWFDLYLAKDRSTSRGWAATRGDAP